ncbi:ankyrin repeat-containing protein At5g02620-like [Macadamia integrifolia]|uniref:ankyrin repeat-containing protein At5g02620-like n=1 Tax=Macadamia integrifolia TaxID=60698 RepID=UPI001C4E7BEB|nr:ankyrin repeat-containing protein At5g02620-like [Macadamia integrifolia]
MERRMNEALVRGDVPAFLDLIKEDENLINQTTSEASDTVLHIAVKFGNLDMATEIVKLQPEMVSAVNKKMETPFHEACREGLVELMELLLRTDPRVAYKLNLQNESVLFVACRQGRFNIVQLLLSNHSRLLLLEDDTLTTSLHVAASAGYYEIVKEILKARSDFAWKKDLHGCSPLHLACNNGHLDITRELILKADPDLSSLQDKDGKTPLHSAAIKGRVNILKEILSKNLDSVEMVTEHGETVLHLSVKNNQYEAVRYLVDTLNITNLLNMADKEGNTVLHLASARKLTAMATYLLTMTNIDVNALNWKGFTALDVVETSGNSSGTLRLKLQEAGCIRSDQLPPRLSPSPWSTSAAALDSPANRHHHNHNHNRRRIEKRLKLHMEGLTNARNNFIVVAVLIATVTFTAGLNPPGGFHQNEGPLLGMSALGKKIAFKVFMVCNNVALFSSMGIVTVLVSVIPFRQESMMKLVEVTHKVIWVSLSFMAAAYLTATWMLTSSGTGTERALVTVLSIGGGCVIYVFMGLLVMLTRHWLKEVVIEEEESPDHLNLPPRLSPSPWSTSAAALDSPANRHHHNHNHNRRRIEKRLKLHMEGLTNARNNFIVVAVLIATVTFTAGLNPPGGFHQNEGPLLGMSALGKKIAFKVFMVCNNVALFSSMGIVTVLVSVIPFRQESMMKLVEVTHKVIWVSLSFMAAAYLTATWMLTSSGTGTERALVTVLSIGGGCVIYVFMGLLVMLTRHWLKEVGIEEGEHGEEEECPDHLNVRVD